MEPDGVGHQHRTVSAVVSHAPAVHAQAATSSSAVRLTSCEARSARGFGRRPSPRPRRSAHCRPRPCRAALAAASRPPSRCSSPRRRDRPGSRRPVRPGAVDRRQDPLDAGAEAAVGIAAAVGERHVVAHHLAHHVGRARGDLGRMRDDDDADLAFMPRLQRVADRLDHQLRRAGARIHMADRAFAEERGAPADRPQRHRRLGAHPAPWPDAGRRRIARRERSPQRAPARRASSSGRHPTCRAP